MIRPLILTAVFGFSIASAAVASDYTILNASSAGLFLDTVARDISGETVVGYGSVGSGHYKAFVYDGSSYAAFNYPSAYQTYATGVDGNNIVGHYEPDSASFSQRGFLYDGITFTPIDHPLAVTITSASGIDGSTIVGWYADASSLHGFIYNGTTYQTLDHPLGVNGTFLQAVSGNKIVGFYVDAANNSVGFLYDGSAFIPISVPGATTTDPLGIDGDLIVGFYQSPASFNRAIGFVFDGTNYYTLDDPPGTGVIGSQVIGVDGYNLVGAFYNSDNHQRGFLTQFVPEPSAIVLLMSCGITVLNVRRRKPN